MIKSKLLRDEILKELNNLKNNPETVKAIENIMKKRFEPRVNVPGAFLSLDDLIKAETPESVVNLRIENKYGNISYYDGDKLIKSVSYECCFYCRTYVISSGFNMMPFNTLGPLSGGSGYKWKCRNCGAAEERFTSVSLL